MHEAKHWTFLSRDGWGSGPWDDESDKVSWTDTKTGLPCLAVRHPENGHWCGYAGVGPSHPLHQVMYSDDENMPHFDVHGGLTYSAPCQPGEDEERGVCHTPGPDEEHDIWWFGFDCAHAWDLSPGLEARLLEANKLMAEKYGPLGPKLSFKGLSDMAFGQHYKTIDYVMLECTRLARQLSIYGEAAADDRA
jgi:hypothetical protein